jgi:hypothetical protein
MLLRIEGFHKNPPSSLWYVHLACQEPDRVNDRFSMLAQIIGVHIPGRD